MDVLISFDEYNTTIQSFLIFDEPSTALLNYQDS